MMAARIGLLQRFSIIAVKKVGEEEGGRDSGDDNDDGN